MLIKGLTLRRYVEGNLDPEDHQMVTEALDDPTNDQRLITWGAVLALIEFTPARTIGDDIIRRFCDSSHPHEATKAFKNALTDRGDWRLIWRRIDEWIAVNSPNTYSGPMTEEMANQIADVAIEETAARFGMPPEEVRQRLKRERRQS